MRTALSLLAVAGYLLQASTTGVPKTWDEQALHDWATPVAGLNVRPSHFSEEEYQRAAVDNLRTYPVYYPGREPAGYWDMLQTVGPQPLVESDTLKTEPDWIRAGKRVFDEYDVPAFRVFDPAVLAAVRSSDFGPYRVLTDAQRRIPARASDEALYALALYIYSLQPPANPNRSDPRIATGQRIFQREGCVNCHTPPLYTNNKVTLAQGFTPPPEHFQFMDIMRVSVGTDPGLALKTRKGTGYYKVPSLKGVWYRGHYLHDGSFTTLEEMFDPARLRDDFVPSGFMPPGLKSRAVKGHEFGLKLKADDKADLMAFLRSL